MSRQLNGGRLHTTTWWQRNGTGTHAPLTLVALLGLVNAGNPMGLRLASLPLLAAMLLLWLRAWRSGVVVSGEGVEVRRLGRARRLHWDEVAGFRHDGADGVQVVTAEGRAVRLFEFRSSPRAEQLLLEALRSELAASGGGAAARGD